jgi:hypothetical protein
MLKETIGTDKKEGVFLKAVNKAQRLSLNGVSSAHKSRRV